MTQRLYLDDSELVRFDAQLVSIRRLGERPAAILDRTAFFPEGGGQPADRGRLGGVEVLDVQEVDGEVLHVLAAELAPGRVEGEVDAGRRLDHVQQHHGQHLLSAAFEATAGARTTSFHLGLETCTIDLEVAADRLGLDALRAAEAMANALVFRNLPVTAREFAPEELASLPLRKEPVKGARVVVVGEAGEIADASPCGGTHPRRTGTVGCVAVLRAARWGSATRVEFACGGRVVRALVEATGRLSGAAAPLRCAPAELPGAVARLAEDAAARRKELEKLLLAFAEIEAERLGAAAAGGPVCALVTAPAPGAPAFLKGVALALAARGRVALLGAVEDGRAHLAFARPKGAGPHLGELVRGAAASLGGKGGGAPDAAQGSGPEPAGLEAALAAAARAIAG
ncbi:MAG TPA: DHHA1 domain-containing protein [Anaeromyxobacteraceae bacterium]|jgi:alanyl-tRNA synthetase|nr:DHHA1 domain-containing protein [Anaeromyxobacteraceae bacterium]